MTRKLAYERYRWLHGQIKAGRYPNARRLASPPTVTDFILPLRLLRHTENWRLVAFYTSKKVARGFSFSRRGRPPGGPPRNPEIWRQCGGAGAPPELRKETAEEIARMTKIYKDVGHLLGEQVW